MPKWTDRQQAAIAARNPSVLVSAAAGSGKTSVLIERIMDMLRKGASLERMLVVTFTRAAASDMRQRLLKALSQEARGSRHLRAQYQALGRGDIGTLHQFCSKLIKRYFQAVGADPASVTGDESRTNPLFERALEEELEALYQSPGEDGQQLIEQYQDTELEQLVTTLHRFLMSLDDPWGWVEEQLAHQQGALRHRPWYAFALTEALEQARAALSLAQEGLAVCHLQGGPLRYASRGETDLAMARDILSHLEQEGQLPAGWNPVFDRLPSTKPPAEEEEALRERFKGLRERFKDALKACRNALPADPEEISRAQEDVAYTQPALRALCQLTRQVHQHYARLKAHRQLWDYSDLEHLALSCLKDPLVRQEVHSQYDALFVDEYQDISRIQEAIIQGLHGPEATLFMVGDVKQSIYRFRLAEPGLFMHKYHSFKPDEKAPERVIHLSENFRSRGNILRGVNHVFTHALRGKRLELDYDSLAALKPGLTTRDDPPVELRLIIPDADAQEADEDGERLDAAQKQAALMADIILSLKGTLMGEGENQRPLRFRDMVILLRSASGRAPRMAEVLQSFGIPVYSDADRQFFDVQEVNDLLNLLKALNNPCDDELLLSVLSAPPFYWDDQEKATLAMGRESREEPLHQVFFRLAEQEGRAKEAMTLLDRWRFQSENIRLDVFLRRLLRETGLYTLAGAKPQGALRRGNLRLLCERAAPDPLPQSLHGFLSRVTEARQQDTALSAATLGAAEDVVRIMTIHKAKGLEFPVVLLPDLSRRFRLHSQGESILLDAQAGMALRKVDPQRRMRYWTLQGKAIQLKKQRETRAEEARLLYVAMTRAQERLILLAAPSRLETARAGWRAGGEYAAAAASSMMEWVGQSLWPALQEDADCRWLAPQGAVFDVRWHPAATLSAAPEGETRGPIPLPALPVAEQTRQAMAPLQPPPSHPLKLSVTQLARRIQEVDEETAFTKRRAYEEEGFVLPPVGSREQSIQRGLATHRALSALNLAALRQAPAGELADVLRQQLNRLLDEGVLNPLERDSVDHACLTAFFSGELGQRLLKAQRLQREWPFSLMVEQGLVLQGVLDCCFLEEEGWVLIDYKTDRAEAPVLLARYRDQMRWYMRALRDITGLPVKQAWLYALRTGEMVPVAEEAPIQFHHY